MKKTVLFLLLTAAANCLIAAELYVDGKFSDFSRNWRISSRKIGSVEMVPVAGVNFVQLAAESTPRGKIGILTAGKGFSAAVGNKFTVSVDVKGGPLEVALFEYGNKKYTGSTRKDCPAVEKTVRQEVVFIVENADTDSVRFAFNVKKGASAVISNVKVEMETASGGGNQ